MLPPQYIFYTTHWMACVFYLVAKLELSEDRTSWVGQASHRFEGHSTFVQ